MEIIENAYFRKRGKLVVDHLQKRHFEAYYCDNASEAKQKVLELIPDGSVVGWGGSMTNIQVGLLDAVRQGNYTVIDRDQCKTPEEKTHAMHQCFSADYFLTGANAISIDGQIVNIDGFGNRVAALIYGPKHVIVLAGMNKVTDTLEQAMIRARTIAAPMNQQRFQGKTPCTQNCICSDCCSEECICNQFVITRNCRPAKRIKIILIGESLGF